MDIQKLANEIMNDEGLELKPYKDSVGKLTIGVGRNLDDDGISKSEALLMLQNDISEVVGELSKLSFWPMICSYDARARALANMAFNLGIPKLLEFQKMLSAIIRMDWERAAAEMENSEWAKQVGLRATRLAAMMRTGL